MLAATELGRMFVTTRARAAALAFAAAIVALDLTLAGDTSGRFPRLLLGVIAALVAAHLAARDRLGATSLGLAPLDPDQHRWWLRVIVAGGAVAAVGIGAIVAVALVRGAPLWTPGMFAPPLEYLMWVCVVWPVYEEVIYRLTLLPVCVAVFGRWPAFAIGAVVFAFLHVRYGNLDPSNALGAVVLTGAFLRSGSLSLSIALHVGGNAAIAAAHLSMYALS